MTIPATISYEDQLKARYRRATQTLRQSAPAKVAQNAKSEPAPLCGPVSAIPAINEATQRQFEVAWQAMTGAQMLPVQYIKAMCFIAGITFDTLKSGERKKWLVKIKRAIIRSVAHRYPRMSSNQIGDLLGMEHTTILFHMGATVAARKKGISPVRPAKPWASKIAPEHRARIVELYHSGLSQKMVAEIMGVSTTCVGSIVHRDRMAKKEAEKAGQRL